MFDQMDITELERLLANLIRIGSVDSVTMDPPRATVTIGDITTAPLPWTLRRAGTDREWWAPSAGEQVVVLSPCGDLAQGVIQGSLYSDAAPAPADSGTVRHVTYADGAVIAYDTEAHKLTATIPGDIDVTADGKATVTAGGDVTISSGATAKISAVNVQIVASQGGSDATTMTGNFKLTGNLQVDGGVQVNGDLAATGRITDAGGNTNHHSH